MGRTAEINRPFSGSLVPTAFYEQDDNVFSVMIEINRSLYLKDEPNNVQPNSNFKQVEAQVQNLMQTAAIFLNHQMT